MNLNSLKISVTPCVVCNYAFSDKHHIWPQAKGGKSLATIYLCPNHHRFANLVQAMVLQGIERERIEAFAANYFDATFNAAVLGFLIDEQQRIAWQGMSLHYLDQIEQGIETHDRAGVLELSRTVLELLEAEQRKRAATE